MFEIKYLVTMVQVSGPTTVELNVNMHCEACAEQLKRKILKMGGIVLRSSIHLFTRLVVLVMGPSTCPC